MSLFEALTTFPGQLLAVFIFACGWGILIESITPRLWEFVKSRSWWAQALPNQRSMMVNFGYPKDGITEDMALQCFTWIITMCITHITSSCLMLPVIIHGWEGAGPIGHFFFLLGSLSEVGFDMYDGPKLFLLAFFNDRFPTLFHGAAAVPPLAFFLVGGVHHITVLSLVIPMNMKYLNLPSYHYIAFSLLFSAGVCYISGHYKFTINAKTPQGLMICKTIVLFQLAINFFGRLFVYFPAAYTAVRLWHASGDHAYLYGGAVGLSFLGLYNLAVLGDAVLTAVEWLGKTCKD